MAENKDPVADKAAAADKAEDLAEVDALPAGAVVRVQMPKGTSSVSFDGIPLKVDAKGQIDTSVEVAARLIESHGATFVAA